MQLEVTPDSLYGFSNLPYGIYRPPGAAAGRVAVRLDDRVIDVGRLLGEGGEDGVFAEPTLNAFMAQGRGRWDDVRARISERLRDGKAPEAAIHPLDTVQMVLPIEVSDYVDFYASENHAANLGRLFRPDSPTALTPNWKHLPIGYNGRAASVVVSGTPVRRPRGQRRDPGETSPVFGPSTRLDIEAELGFIVGVGSPMGDSIPPEAAAEHIFGVALFNDWSARDIQAWESVPLGPNLGKSFASTMSAWVVPLAALEPARIPVPAQSPEPLSYLQMADPWGLDIDYEVYWNGQLVSRPPYATTYWSPAQMLAHMTVNGAPARTGDLFASGTISGPERAQRGALIELTWGGAEPIKVGTQLRTFLEDGDTIELRATAPAADGTRLGFGHAVGQILPSHS